jgi:hypothetical protein
LKTIFYVIIPIVAFILIFLNAFFGHLLFESPYGQDINKYSIYVHLQSGWNSYPRNILYEITNVWSNPKPESNSSTFNYDPSISESLVTDYNSNELQFQNQKPFVELKHEFSDCEISWKPVLYRHAIDSIRNDIEYMQGKQLNQDPYVQVFPNVVNIQYDSKTQQELIKQSFAQFIPICTTGNSTSYDFSVSINDENIGFDVYFVPSKNQLDSFISSKTFDFYPQNGCYAKNMHSYSGTCNNVGSNSGLLILVPDKLDLAVTKININLHEKK